MLALSHIEMGLLLAAIAVKINTYRTSQASNTSFVFFRMNLSRMSIRTKLFVLQMEKCFSPGVDQGKDLLARK